MRIEKIFILKWALLIRPSVLERVFLSRVPQPPRTNALIARWFDVSVRGLSHLDQMYSSTSPDDIIIVLWSSSSLGQYIIITTISWIVASSVCPLTLRSGSNVSALVVWFADQLSCTGQPSWSIDLDRMEGDHLLWQALKNLEHNNYTDLRYAASVVVAEGIQSAATSSGRMAVVEEITKLVGNRQSAIQSRFSQSAACSPCSRV